MPPEKSVRRYSSADRAENPDAATAPVPMYWYRPPHPLATAAGMHRFTWDLHYQPLVGGGGRGGLPIAAVPRTTRRRRRTRHGRRRGSTP